MVGTSHFTPHTLPFTLGRRPFVPNKANLARDCFHLDGATQSNYDAQPLQSARIVEEL